METIFQSLLECNEQPFNSDEDVESIKSLLHSAGYSSSPVIFFDYTPCRTKVQKEELIENLNKFKGIIEIAQTADENLTITFDSFLNSVNFIKFFTLANQVEFNPFIFNMSFEKIKADSNVLKEAKLKQLPKDNKKKDSTTAKKFTARFYFYIESCCEFELAKKIIGKKGKNMKNVLTQCESMFKGNKIPKDFLKLRLRGKGSSYKEGSTNKESDEDLHLCVSAKTTEVLTNAVQHIENLLDNIYNEYLAYCKKHEIKAVRRLYRLVSDLKR